MAATVKKPAAKKKTAAKKKPAPRKAATVKKRLPGTGATNRRAGATARSSPS